MTEENSGKNTEEKTVIDIRLERVHAENKQLRAAFEGLQKQFDSVVQERDTANATMEYEERGQMRDALRVMGCTYGADELDGMSIDQLDKLKRHYTNFQVPPFKSGADVSRSRKSVYDSLDSVYVPLDVRKKAHQEA